MYVRNSFAPSFQFYSHFQKGKNQNLAWQEFAKFCKIGCPLSHDFSLPMLEKQNPLATLFRCKNDDHRQRDF